MKKWKEFALNIFKTQSNGKRKTRSRAIGGKNPTQTSCTNRETAGIGVLCGLCRSSKTKTSGTSTNDLTEG
jgi:hypothetical protein